MNKKTKKQAQKVTSRSIGVEILQRLIAEQYEAVRENRETYKYFQENIAKQEKEGARKSALVAQKTQSRVFELSAQAHLQVAWDLEQVLEETTKEL